MLRNYKDLKKEYWIKRINKKELSSLVANQDQSIAKS